MIICDDWGSHEMSCAGVIQGNIGRGKTSLLVQISIDQYGTPLVIVGL